MDAKDNVADLEHKLSAVETAKVEIEARLHMANHALERLSSFVSVWESDLQCPRCWINDEVTRRFAAHKRWQRQRVSVRDLQKRFQFADLNTALARYEPDQRLVETTD